LVTGIALANGANANRVRRWMRERGISAPAQRLPISPAAETTPPLLSAPITPMTVESSFIQVESNKQLTLFAF